MTAREGSITVAVDAMGGDNAPGEVVAGAVEAARGEGVRIGLVGDPDALKVELAKHDTQGLPITLVPSEGVILEDDQPALALRQKPMASILVSTRMVKEGLADASVTMGSTGAAMAAGVVVLGVIEGIDRPALGGPVIGLAPNTAVIDVGSNVDCRPSQMLSFAVIGDVFARQFWGIERPRVALISVGAESGKGNRQVREATELIVRSGLNFVGNVEANELPLSKVDVAVCDGFVGNIVMKLTEGLGAAIVDHLRGRLSDKLSEDDLDQVSKELYDLNNVVETWGGGPLFGVNGVSVVGHGRAKAGGVRRAIATAKLAVEVEFVPKLNQELADVKAKVGE